MAVSLILYPDHNRFLVKRKAQKNPVVKDFRKDRTPQGYSSQLGLEKVCFINLK